MDKDEDIRKRAHEIWEEEGRPHGRADEHWQQARRELGIDDGLETPEIAEDELGLPSDINADAGADPAISPLETDTPPSEGLAKPDSSGGLGRLGRFGK